jgi:hypothetical protein
LLQQQQQQQQLQIHHSSFQTQKTLLITPAHGLQNRRTQKCREVTARQQRRREGTNARARLKTRGRRPTKERTEEPKSSSYILRVLSQGGPAGAFRPGYHSGCPLQLGIPYRPVLYFWYPIQSTTAWFCIFKNLITYLGDPIILQVGRLIKFF